jgi:hypothetical protein
MLKKRLTTLVGEADIDVKAAESRGKAGRVILVLIRVTERNAR